MANKKILPTQEITLTKSWDDYKLNVSDAGFSVSSTSSSVTLEASGNGKGTNQGVINTSYLCQVNLTNYKTLGIEFSGCYTWDIGSIMMIVGSDTSTITKQSSVLSKQGGIPNSGTATIDVSDLSGNYYVGIRFSLSPYSDREHNPSGKITISNMYLTENTYSITYNPGSYGTGSTYTDSANIGSKITLRGAIYTRTGYVQTGWSTSSTGTTKNYNLSTAYSLSDGTVLYPYWELDVWTISYESNGGTGTTNSQQVIKGYPTNLRKNNFTPPSNTTPVYTLRLTNDNGGLSNNNTAICLNNQFYKWQYKINIINKLKYAQVANSTNIYGSDYNGDGTADGYLKDKRISENDATSKDGTYTGPLTNFIATGWIPYTYTKNNIIYIKNGILDMSNKYTRLYLYDTKTKLNSSGYLSGSNIETYFSIEYPHGNNINYYKLIPKENYLNNYANVTYIRLSLESSGDNFIITTTNQPIYNELYPEQDLFIPENNVTFKAKWSTNYKFGTATKATKSSIGYQVNFNAYSEGGTCSTHILNSTIYTHYDFLGWKDLKSENIYQPEDIINIINNETYRETWNSTIENGSIKLPEAQKNPSSTSITITLNPNKGQCNIYSLMSSAIINYSFDGWYDSNNIKIGKTDDIFTPNQSITLFAKFSSTQEQFSTIELPTPTRAGYEFKGWSSNIESSEGFFGNYTPKGNETILYAIWKPKGTVRISYGPSKMETKAQVFIFKDGEWQMAQGWTFDNNWKINGG